MPSSRGGPSKPLRNRPFFHFSTRHNPHVIPCCTSAQERNDRLTIWRAFHPSGPQSCGRRRVVRGHLKPASKERIKASHFEGMIAGSAARLHISVNEPTQSEFATSHIDAGQAWEVASRDRSWPTGAFCQFVPPAGTRAGLSQRDNLHLWQRSRTPFYFIFIFFVRFSARRDILRRNA